MADIDLAVQIHALAPILVQYGITARTDSNHITDLNTECR